MSDAFGLSGSIDNIGSALTSSTTAGYQSLAASAINRGATAVQAQNYDLAITEFRRAAAYQPSDPSAYEYMAQTYMMMNQPDDAVGAYKKALAVDPQNADVKYSLAQVYIGENDYNSAEPLLKDLVKSNPSNMGPPTTLGFLYMNQGRYAEADTQFSKVAMQSPTSSTAFYNLGLLRNKQGQYEDAVSQFQQALTLDPKNENAHADLAYAYMGLDQPDDAETQYNILADMGTDAANNLLPQVSQAINTPQFSYLDSTQSNFDTLLGPNTDVSTLDPTLSTAGASKVFHVTFRFNQDMDTTSVLNISNWSIGKGTGGTAGAYNYGANLNPDRQVGVPAQPLGVIYNPQTKIATVYFKISQNAAGNGLIDPSHIVFGFHGMDVYGRTMDQRGDQYDGHAITPF
jgi:Flp pilus assembly protein TadD